MRMRGTAPATGRIGLKGEPSPPHPSRGSSAAELLATCAVLGILLRTAVPTIAGVVTSYRLQGATRQVAADLQQARMSAIAENNRYSFRLVDTGTYSVHDDVNNNGTIDPGEAVTTVALGATGWPGVTIAGDGIVTFLPNGMAVSAGTLTLSGSGKARTVTVSQGGMMRAQ